jgi:hypothetical protein
VLPEFKLVRVFALAVAGFDASPANVLLQAELRDLSHAVCPVVRQFALNFEYGTDAYACRAVPARRVDFFPMGQGKTRDD